ncbi:hypothetical protein [Caballeronia sp. INDeC2]|uniref:hypothetical protein n=1 Tax=Caballeronia sp. INDeC2 TaxID=2921747 RepID=UPI002027F7DD|nr:hypothetical protein [Caballeronia sp. INDeC2]
MSGPITRQPIILLSSSSTRVIAVLRDERERGGSKALLHEQLRVQDIVRVSPPRNTFT